MGENLGVETNFSRKADRSFTRRGVRYVFCTNVGRGDKFYKAFRQLQRMKKARIIFRMRAYSIYAKSPEDAMPGDVAVFVAEEDIPVVDKEIEKL